MMELDELKCAINWDGVFQGRDCLVIAFDENDAGKIQGLDQNDQTLFLKFPEYKDELISFRVTRGPEVFQYWVLGEHLHRINAPAKLYWGEDQTKSEWYRRGLLHNQTGPARIQIKNPSLSTIHPDAQEDMGDYYAAERWSEMTAQWFVDGERAKFPLPDSAHMENGYRIHAVSGHSSALDNFKGYPALKANRLIVNWGRENDKLEPDVFRIRRLTAREYTRNYDMNRPGLQDCTSIDEMVWVLNGELATIDDSEKRERMKKDLFPEWNIWDGPFFANEQERMFAYSEVTS